MGVLGSLGMMYLSTPFFFVPRNLFSEQPHVETPISTKVREWF